MSKKELLLDDEDLVYTRTKSKWRVFTYFPRKLADLLLALVNGPANPRKSEVSLPFQRVQLFPEHLKTKFPPFIYHLLAAGLLALCILMNLVLAHKGYWGPKDTGYERLACGINENIWRGPLADCGLDGELCFPEAVPNTIFKFKCPANCYFEGRTFREWHVGNETVYRYPYAVGGPEIYRGDSFICVAALHAGLISAKTGGCGAIEWLGPHSEFPSTLSVDQTYKTLGFDSLFPVNFRFVVEECHECKNRDLRTLHMSVNAVFVYLVSYLSTNPAYLLFSLISIGFWTVLLASNPAFVSEFEGTECELFSRGLGRFLPCMMAAMWIYVFATKPLMKNMRAHLSCALLFGTAFFVGVIENYVFGLLPLDRLIISDLKNEPGAWTAFVTGLLILLLIIVSQAYMFWANGKFRTYFTFYILQLAALTVLAKTPLETLRIHHYILALILLPGTCLQTTPSLLYQGLLIGLYVSGIARWDFASIVQTDDQLSRGSEQVQSADPHFDDTDISASGVVLHWTGNPNEVFNGYTLAINDVQRLVEPAEKFETFNLTEYILATDPELTAPKYYIRVAAAALGKHNRQVKGKFSEPVVIEREVLQLL